MSNGKLIHGLMSTTYLKKDAVLTTFRINASGYKTFAFTISNKKLMYSLVSNSKNNSDLIIIGLNNISS